MQGTMSCIKLPSTLVGSSLHLKMKAQSMDHLPGQDNKSYKPTLANIDKIDECKDEDDKSEGPSTGANKVKGFLIADDDDSEGSSSSGDEEKEEDDRKDAMELVDSDIKNLLLSFDSLQRPTAEQIKELKVEFGTVDRQKTLILDMDETLIHAKPKISANSDFEPDYEISLEDDDGSELIFMVKMRPGLVECLERLAKFYELAVFTAAERTYATKIINHFDPDKKFIKHILSREHCIHVENFYVKDLRIIGDRKTEDLVIVDNSIVAFAFNLDNGVPINDFRGEEPMDEELIYMTSYLEDIYHFEDIREANINNFKLSEIQQSARK